MTPGRLALCNAFDRVGAESADQLVLQVGLAHEEAEGLHVGAREVAAEARLLERAPVVALLRRVAQAGNSCATTEQAQEPGESLRTPDAI